MDTKATRIANIIAAQKARTEAGKRASAIAPKNDAEWHRKGGTRN